MNSKRVDPKKVREIKEFLARMARSIDPRTGRQPKPKEILFLEIQTIQATAREHADGRHPLHPNEEIRLKLYTKEKRDFNATDDRKKLIIGVPHTVQTIGGNKRRFHFEELAHKGPAGYAKQHQDKLNKGGYDKSKKLQECENDPTLKAKHEREARELLRRLRRR